MESDSESVTDRELERDVAMLSARQRVVFEANAAGASYAEIASRLRLTMSTVAKRLHDARRKLRGLLRKAKRQKDGER